MNSHTVQKAYLRAFLLDTSRDRQFDVYSKTEKLWRRKSPKSTTVEPDYYAFRRSDGTLDNSVEDNLNKIETPGIQGLRKLSLNQPLRPGEKQAISLYLGCLLTRTTKIRATQLAANVEIAKPENVRTFIDANRDKFERMFPKEHIDEYIQLVDSGGHCPKLPESWYLHMLNSSGRFASLIFGMNWIVESTRGPDWFLTSDNPAFVCCPSRPYLPFTVGLIRRDRDAELCFPLTATKFLRASFFSSFRGRGRSTPSRVRELNRRVTIHATEFVIAPERSAAIDSLVNEENDTFVRSIDPKWVFRST